MTVHDGVVRKILDVMEWDSDVHQAAAAILAALGEGDAQ